MRVLLDECVPRRLRTLFLGHDIRTVPEMGWAGIKNGRLFTLVNSQQFVVFLTVDQNIKFQQNLANIRFAIVLLIGSTNRFADLAPLAPSALRAMATIKVGQLVQVTT
jgi:hypothetical protein